MAPENRAKMELVNSLSLGILLGSLLALAGILSSLVAMRFGAPLLLVFVGLGMLAGEAGPGGIDFDNVAALYVVASIALAIILFDGGLRTKLNTFRNVIGPAGSLATLGVLLTATFTAPAAMLMFGFPWLEALLVGALLASTDAAAVFFLIHARGLRLRPRVGATLEVESGINDPFAILLTLILIEFLVVGQGGWQHVLLTLVMELGLGTVVGFAGGWAIVFVLNRLALPQGLHAPFVMMGALVIFGLAAVMHASGFLAVYLAGVIVGNRPTRAHNTVIVFLDAITWLAQIAMFTLLGLIAWPDRLPATLVGSLVVATVLMLVARPLAVFICLAPFRFPWREKAFISWVGLRGAVSVFLASIPLLVGTPHAGTFFDVAFVVVVTSLLIQGWSIPWAARRLHIALPRSDAPPRRVELDLPGQLEQEMVGYEVGPHSLYLRRRLIPAWARPALIVRDERIMMPNEAEAVREGDYIYLLAPPEKAQALDRFFVDMPPPASPDPRELGDFFLTGDATLGALAEIYDLQVDEEEAQIALSAYFAEELDRNPRQGDVLFVGPIALVAHTIDEDRVTMVGLRLTEDEPLVPAPLLRAVQWPRQALRWLRKRTGF